MNACSEKPQVLVTRMNDWQPQNVIDTITAKYINFKIYLNNCKFFFTSNYNCIIHRCDVEFLSPNGLPSWRARLLDRIAGKHALICIAYDIIDREVLDAAGITI